MSDPPLVTIGVPVRNGENHLAEALDSALAQEYPNVEILVSDNASVDATPDICRRYAEADPRIRWWRNDENIGLGYNFALTAERARGDFFTWLAHDDLLGPGYVSTVIAYMAPRPDVLLGTTSLHMLGLEGPGVLTPVRLFDFYDGVDWREARRHLFRVGHTEAGHLVYGMYRRAAMPDVRRLVRDFPSRDVVSALPELLVLSWIAARGRIVALPSLLRTSRAHDASATVRLTSSPPRRRIWRRLRGRIRILRHAVEAPLPRTERAELAITAAGSLFRGVGDERLALIERLDAECKARQRQIDELRGKSSTAR